METKLLKHWMVGLSLTASFFLPTQLAAQNITVMPMGDSITRGARGECGYRRALSQALAKNPQCSVSFVGSRTGAGNDSNIPISVCAAQNTPHEATSGLRADQLLNLIDGPITNHQPDVVLLHIGSNDIFQDRAVVDTLTDIDDLLDRVFINKPDASVVLSDIIPWSEASPNPISFAPLENPNRDMLADTTQLATDIALLASARASAGDSVEKANVWKDFDSDLMTTDGVHPNPVGEAHIANKMLNALYKLGACGEQPADIQAPIAYISVPAQEDAVLSPNSALSGEVLDEGGSGINRVRIAIQNSEGLWLQHLSGTFHTTFDSSIVATMTNTTTNKTDWSFTPNLSAGNYRVHVLGLDNAGNQVDEAAGNGLPDQNKKVWTNRAFEIATKLLSNSASFSWADIDPNIVQYRLTIGSDIGGNQFFDSNNLGRMTSVEATGLPTDGSTVQLRLWYQYSDYTWQFVDSTYTTPKTFSRWRYINRHRYSKRQSTASLDN